MNFVGTVKRITRQDLRLRYGEIRTRPVRWLRTVRPWLAFLLAVCVVATEAAAADPVTIRPGESVVVARNAKPFDNMSADKGAVSSTVSPTNPATHALVYYSPAIAASLDDVVRYTVNGQSDSVQVRVRMPASSGDDDIYSASLKALVKLFVLAVLVESGLALIFRWRPFLNYFDTRSVNALVAFGFSFLLVSLFNLDITTGLLNVYGPDVHPPNLPGKLLTAMIIAGGSAGVNRIFRALGFRPIASPEEDAPKPTRDNEAWVSVRVDRSRAVGPLDVCIGTAAAPAVAGTISGTARTRSALAQLFVRDQSRFPRSGGYTVTPGQEYVIKLSGEDANGQPVSASWGPHVLAPRAVIDLEMKV